MHERKSIVMVQLVVWKQFLHALLKSPQVARGLKADQVVGEQRFQHLIAPWQLKKDIRRWEWDMQEEPDWRANTGCTQLGRYAHQVIVLYPDVVGGLGRFGNRKCKFAINR